MNATVEDPLRVCTKCGSHKGAGEFYRQKGRGFHSWCKVCLREAVRLSSAGRPRPSRFQKERAEYHRQWAAKNREARRAAYRKWVAQNRETRSAYFREWSRKNPGKITAAQAANRTKRLQACPPWVDHSAIVPFYEEARRVSLETGIVHHVDHIVPLCGKTVCGLHVPWNLQVIPGSENRRKSNRHI